MFFDRYIGEHKYPSYSINVATISIYNRELLGLKERELKIKKAQEIIGLLNNNNPLLIGDPLIRKREEEIRLLEQGMSDETHKLNDFINDRVSCFLLEMGWLPQESEAADSECVLIPSGPEVLVKNRIDLI